MDAKKKLNVMSLILILATISQGLLIWKVQHPKPPIEKIFERRIINCNVTDAEGKKMPEWKDCEQVVLIRPKTETPLTPLTINALKAPIEPQKPTY